MEDCSSSDPLSASCCGADVSEVPPAAFIAMSPLPLSSVAVSGTHSLQDRRQDSLMNLGLVSHSPCFAHRMHSLGDSSKHLASTFGSPTAGSCPELLVELSPRESPSRDAVLEALLSRGTPKRSFSCAILYTHCKVNQRTVISIC